MKFIKPITLTPAMITATTATESVALWAAGTTYALNATARFGNRIYRSLQASNTNQQPDTATAWWTDIGPSNQTALIDGQVSNRTTATNSLSVTLTPGRGITGIGLAGMAGSSVTVTMTNSGTTVFTRTARLTANTVTSWFDYVFSDITLVDQVTMFDLPFYPAATITITVTGTGTVSIGEVVMGTVRSIGDDSMQYGVSVGISDYSQKTTNSAGVTTFTKGAWSRKVSGTFMLDTAAVYAAQAALAELRSTPTFVEGGGNSALSLYGYVRDFSIVISYPTRSLCRIEIEGLV